MERILNSSELYEIAKQNEEDESCIAFVNWILDLPFSDRYNFLSEIARECFTKETWLEYIRKNW